MKMMFLYRCLLITLLAATVAGLTGCNTVPITGRKQFTGLVSTSQEMQLGLTSFEELKKSTPISKNAEVNSLVQKVGKHIAMVATPDMPNAQWEFVVFDSKEANAFCLPGGKVGVYTGILPITKDESGMATVIGHEVAHAIARHGAERMTEAMALEGVGSYLGTKVNSNWLPYFNAGYGLASQGFVVLPHSRAQESEADHMGLVYMARAGYSPEAAVDFWKRFAQFNSKNGGNNTLSFLRTHPTDETRTQQLQLWMPEAKAQYKAQ